MLFLLTILHLATLICMAMLWLHETKGRMVITPFILFALIDVTFSWNYWLLFQDIGIDVSAYTVMVSLTASASLLLGYFFTTAYNEVMGQQAFPQKLADYLDQPFSDNNQTPKYAVLLVCLLIGGIGAGLMYYRKVPPVAEGLTVLIKSGDLVESRSIVSSGRRHLTKSHVFGGEYRGQGVFKSLTFDIWIYGLITSIILAIRNKRSIWKAFCMLFFLGGFFFIAGTGERGTFLWGLIAVVIGISFSLRMDIRKIMLAGIVFAVILTSLTFVLPRYQIKSNKSEMMFQIFYVIGQRIFQGNKINNVHIMNLIENGKFDYAYGKEHLNLLLNIIPGIHRPPLGHRLGEALGSHKTTYYSGSYLGKVYMDFGILGTGMVYFGLGVVVALSFSWLLSLPKRMENVAFMSLVIYKLGYMSISAGVISLLSNMVPLAVVHLMALFCIHLLGQVSPVFTGPEKHKPYSKLDIVASGEGRR